MKLIIGFIVILFGGMIAAREHDKRVYNNGICKVCGGQLTRYDRDSQGGRGYVCYTCEPHNYVGWISYPWVDHKHVNP